jgi:type I restriction enzyme M protein
LPTGLFYKQGVKANVLFFQRRAAAAEPATSQVWIYDLRTNQHFTLKENPLQDADLRDFVACYQAGARHERAESERFHYFEYADLILREKVDLDITWIADESVESADNLPDPMLLAEEIAAELEATLADFAEIGASLRARSVVSTDTVHGG